jgi:hypothetical protein
VSEAISGRPSASRGDGPGADARIAEILAAGRAMRRRPARATWIAAAAVGALCALCFVLLLLVDGGGGAASEPGGGVIGTGCGGSLGLGLGIGIGIGFLLGRRQRADHSSRRRP